MPDESGLVPSSEKLIMVVDDDDGIRDMLGFVIKREGFRVATAVDGEDGLAKIQASMPDLVLLDLMLPRYGGFEVLRRLQEGDTSRIPIIIITGRYTDRTTVEMIRQESNVMDFLEKPLKPQALALSLHKILKTLPPSRGQGV